MPLTLFEARRRTSVAVSFEEMVGKVLMEMAEKGKSR